MGHEKACIFMNTNIAAYVSLYVCVSERIVLRCVFSSLPVQHQPPPPHHTPPFQLSEAAGFICSATKWRLPAGGSLQGP